tara:strand:+ start:600 stop:869 length:270 start_codon:yes stop_codon:yes gene_type:complete
MDGQLMYRDDYTPAEVKAFLKRAGTKIAVQIAFDGAFIFAEKSDFIASFLTGPDFIDYDGEPCSLACFTNADDPIVMFITAGTDCGRAS